MNIDIRKNNKVRKISASRRNERRKPSVIITDHIPSGPNIDVKDIEGTEMSLEEAKKKGFIKSEESVIEPEEETVTEVLSANPIVVGEEPVNTNPTFNPFKPMLIDEPNPDPQEVLNDFIEDLKMLKELSDFTLVDQNGNEITGMGIVRQNVQITSF